MVCVCVGGGGGEEELWKTLLDPVGIVGWITVCVLLPSDRHGGVRVTAPGGQRRSNQTDRIRWCLQHGR